MLHDGQAGFTAALLEPGLDAPHNVVDPQGRIAPKRFAVYRNNVTVSLIEALKATFPAVLALVGEEFFSEMARQFARQSPPQSPLLFEYGRAFPDFVAKFPPASGLPFLSDIARLDRAWLDAYHAADAAPLQPARLVGIAEKDLPDIRFGACPATRLVPSEYPLVTIWRAARAGATPHFDSVPQAEWALVTRSDFEVEVLALDIASGHLFAGLLAGDALGIAAEAAMQMSPDFDFASAFAGVVNGGAFAEAAPRRGD